MAKEYRALNGMNYPDPARPGKEKRVERGDMVKDMPESAIAEALAHGDIEKMDPDAPLPEVPKEG